MFHHMESPSANPLRDLFDAAARRRTVRLTCRRCRHENSFAAAALWWHFRQRGWVSEFAEVQRRMVCRWCIKRHGMKIRNPRLRLTEETPLDNSLAMPTELDWKHELRRRR
jgi:hypothetical protein